ncbi:unnamed protein product, partial [Rhizoctonia solani]
MLAKSPRGRFRYAIDWMNLAFQHSPLNLMEACQAVIDLLPQFIWLGATTTQRYRDLSMTENLAAAMCLAAIQSSSYSLALEWLEHTRCVVWNQSLMLRSPLDELRASHSDLATRIETIADELYGFSFDLPVNPDAHAHLVTAEQVGQRRRQLAVEYNNLLAQARQLPNFEDLFQPLTINRIIPAAQNGPVVVINYHSGHCDALILMPKHDQVKHLHLPQFNEGRVRQTRSELAIASRRKERRRRHLMPQVEDDDSLEGVLNILWSDIVKPVLDELGYINNVSSDRLPHITWCLTGSLSFLPLHAAGDYNQPLCRVFDYAVSSYAPTLSALLASTPCSLNRSHRVLAVGQSATPGHRPLPGTASELAYIQVHTENKLEFSQLIDEQATVEAVLDAMEQHDWVHLACHAHQNVQDPTKSGFFLHDGTLDLSSINRRSFKSKGLAFLSACQTATGDESLPDEAIHLASGMLMAGYASVIATMWSV